jgi:hypothetical protein
MQSAGREMAWDLLSRGTGGHVSKLKSTRVLSVIVAVALALSITGCGTILYPERRGQTGGRVDGGVVVMDALWCLVFLVPGVVAFIVDFGNGTIYDPGGRR